MTTASPTPLPQEIEEIRKRRDRETADRRWCNMFGGTMVSKDRDALLQYIAAQQSAPLEMPRPKASENLGCKICGATVLNYDNASELLKDCGAFGWEGNRARTKAQQSVRVPTREEIKALLHRTTIYGPNYLSPGDFADAILALFTSSSLPAQPEGWKPTGVETQSGYSRLEFAEGLIRQLPPTHDGRNTWLLNYGISDEAKELRARRKIGFNPETKAAYLATDPPAQPDKEGR